MIHYENHLWGLPLLTQLYGSAFPRALLFATLAAVETAALYKLAPSYISQALRNPTLYQIFGFVVGFALVFRSSLSYNRFWEARTMLQSVMGRLSYFTIESIATDLGSMDHETATDEQRRAAHRFVVELCHTVSLLFALMVKQLRKDGDLGNLYAHDMAGPPPFLDSNQAIRGWKRWEVFLVRILSLNDLFEIHNPQQEAAIPVIGGLREEERRRLTDLVPTPAMKGRGSSLNGTRSYAVFALMYQLYVRRIAEGGLRTLPPLASRLGGVAEEGMAAFGQCAKLAATQFPFPWAQVVMVFLAILAVSLPFVVTGFVGQLWMGVALSFIVVLTYWSLNEVASEMEDPFGFDPNDMPLARYAFDFNNGILSAVHQLRPPYFDQLDAEAEAQAGSSTPAAAAGESREEENAALPESSVLTPAPTPGQGQGRVQVRPAAESPSPSRSQQPLPPVSEQPTPPHAGGSARSHGVAAPPPPPSSHLSTAPSAAAAAGSAAAWVPVPAPRPPALSPAPQDHALAVSLSDARSRPPSAAAAAAPVAAASRRSSASTAARRNTVVPVGGPPS